MLRATFYEIKVYVGQFVANDVFNGMLLTLLVLNVMWTVLIMRLIYEQLVTGKVTENIQRCWIYCQVFLPLEGAVLCSYRPRT